MPKPGSYYYDLEEKKFETENTDKDTNMINQKALADLKIS